MLDEIRPWLMLWFGLDLACVKVRSDDPGLLAWSFGEVGAEPSVAEF